MSERITKDMAKNIYFGGGIFATLIFVGLTFDSVNQIPELSNEVNMTESVVLGKKIWEDNNCVGCHTLLGEGAYYAPELGNVFQRAGSSNEEAFKGYMLGWMAAQPLDIPDRRKMPQFHLSPEQVNNLSDFLIWTSKVNTQEWPPNIQG
ncbi:MAG: cytochrome c [Sulfurimonas sp.]|jgi:nitric oxide reductase subunit C|uniref:c-type cytochrome n=1 Tax=Sulfurimonas sp. TaxID=2022749 RepID=UPI00261B2220|nr:cytochrome c [Sulfurimonas sp.]MDD3476256.1 cytochrome c [Sulfurimonas sp.]HUH43437.1 cytochrome c [Sulfurimonas sp.]